MAILANDPEQQLSELYTDMAPRHLFPLWEVLSNLVPPQPASPARPCHWQFGDVRDYLLRAGDLITAERAERRVLILENPGLPGSRSITRSLYAGLQLILPGETAPCHRHSQSALRFVMSGEGAYTAIDGEKAVMSPFDLILTPGGQWHDHGNDSGMPMIWLDGLDIPTVQHFDAGFAERLGQSMHPETRPAGDSLARYGSNLRPFSGSSGDTRRQHYPLFHYPYAQWRKVLEETARSGDIDPHLGHALEFINPRDGGPVMPTIAAHVRLLPAGFSTLPRRSTDGTVFVVVEGSGTVTIDGEPIALAERDIVVAPAWSRLIFEARSDLVLFGYSDKAAQQALRLFREKRE